MKANSDHHPGSFTKSNTKTFVNYNIKKVETTDPETGKMKNAWNYDYVEIDGEITKAKFKDALWKKDKEKNDEIAWTPDEAVLEYEQEKSKSTTHS